MNAKSVSGAAQPLVRSRALCQSARRSAAWGSGAGRNAASSRQAAAASAGDGHTPSAMPARDAAPSTVVSGFAGRRTGTPSTSAWNWQSTSIALGAAVDAQLGDRDAGRGGDGVDDVGGLPRHRLDDRAHEVRARRAAREPEDRAARVRVEPRRAESGERGHEHHAVGVVDARRERSRLPTTRR